MWQDVAVQTCLNNLCNSCEHIREQGFVRRGGLDEILTGLVNLVQNSGLGLFEHMMEDIHVGIRSVQKKISA